MRGSIQQSIEHRMECVWSQLEKYILGGQMSSAQLDGLRCPRIPCMCQVGHYSIKAFLMGDKIAKNGIQDNDNGIEIFDTHCYQ